MKAIQRAVRPRLLDLCLRQRLLENRYPILLMAVALAQVALLVRGNLIPLVERVSLHSGGTPIERSARPSFGDRIVDFILFIQDKVPEDALVALPPPEVDAALGHTGIMQYLLFPRRTTNCPSGVAWEDCLRNLGGPNTYVLRIGPYPPSSITSLSKEYVAFDSELGLYAPTSGTP